MEAKAIAKYVRIAPRKVRIVIDLIRGKNVTEALAVLKNTPKVASGVIFKVLKSAIANAEHNYDMNSDALYVAAAFVDQGPTLKRVHPRSRGQAFKILKRSSLVTVVVKERSRGGGGNRSGTESQSAWSSPGYHQDLGRQMVR